MSQGTDREFERIAKDYDRGRRSENVPFWAEETARFARLGEGSLALDLGCGTGIYTLGLLGETGARMVGLDPVSGMLRQALGKSRDVLWLNAVGERIPLRDDVFHCIFSSQVWHHLPDRQATANECFRVLGPGGTQVIRTISHEQLREKVVFRFFPEIMAHQLEVYPSREDFERYLKGAGFSTVDHISYNLERYQEASEFIEVAEKRLWSMFRPITEEGLRRGVEELRRHERYHPGVPIRNDETITLVIARKK